MMKVCYSEMDTPAMQALRLPGRTSFVQEPAP